jgi:hypothetical protein
LPPAPSRSTSTGGGRPSQRLIVKVAGNVVEKVQPASSSGKRTGWSGRGFSVATRQQGCRRLTRLVLNEDGPAPKRPPAFADPHRGLGVGYRRSGEHP